MSPTTQAGNLVQMMNSVHVECQKGNWDEANKRLGYIQAQMQILSRELWLQTHRSGEVK